MQIIADLQLHSKYARAVSQNMVPSQIDRWAAKKGIGLVATGDWTHPLWFKELAANLEEKAPGLFGLKKGVLPLANPGSVGPAALHPTPTSSPLGKLGTAGGRAGSPRASPPSPLFLLSTEVSCIYTQGGKQRRIHILIFAPSFATVEKINRQLASRGANLMSDGRPIIGLSARQVAELVLSIDENCLLIPAHVWTPWYSLYGSMSGFDSIEECFGEYSKYIFAIETGLSSDSAMNWRIKELDNRSIVSFSDAHSPAKLGREATVFEIPELSYENVRKAIVASPASLYPRASPAPHIAYTIEFYPEEGKYHYTGHRNCGVKQSPEEAKTKGVICPVCGRKLTVGVMQRVEELADRKLTTDNPGLAKRSGAGWKPATDEYGVRWIKHPQTKKPPYVMAVPLIEILAETLNSGILSQTTTSEYEKLTQILGPEFTVLLQTKPEDIERVGGPRVREAVMKVRSGDIFVDPGFDGVFGKVRIWPLDSARGKEEGKEQMGLFGDRKL